MKLIKQIKQDLKERGLIAEDEWIVEDPDPNLGSLWIFVNKGEYAIDWKINQEKYRYGLLNSYRLVDYQDWDDLEQELRRLLKKIGDEDENN